MRFGVRTATPIYGPRDERVGTSFGTWPMTYLTYAMARAVAYRWDDDFYAWVVPLDVEAQADMAARVKAQEAQEDDQPIPW